MKDRHKRTQVNRCKEKVDRGMFGFLKKQGTKSTVKSKRFNLETLGTDMHSHLIPGIDDGAKNMEDTIKMLKKFSDLGYKKVITTPHILWDYYKNTSETILGGLEKVRAEIKNQNIDIEIEAAAEYYFDSHFLELIRKDELLTFGNNHLLFELPFTVKPNNVDQLIFTLIGKGYQPILAHYERYVYYHSKSMSTAKDFRRRGVLIQMNLLSLIGHYGLEVKKQAEQMVDEGLIDFLGTDCHRIEHLQILEHHLSKEYFRKLSDLSFKNNLL